MTKVLPHKAVEVLQEFESLLFLLKILCLLARELVTFFSVTSSFRRNNFKVQF